MLLQFRGSGHSEQQVLSVLRECEECGEVYGPKEGCACKRLARRTRTRILRSLVLAVGVASFGIAISYLTPQHAFTPTGIVGHILVGTFAAACCYRKN